MTVRHLRARVAASAGWQDGLLLTGRNQPKAGLANVLHVLSQHPDWQDVLAYNEFAESVVILREPPVRPQDAVTSEVLGEWTEERSVRTAAWFAQEVGFEPRTVHVEQAVAAIARRTKVHPPRDYLRSQVWDETLRLDGMLTTYFGSPDTPYTRAVGSRWMISAVARVFRPGCQADSMLVLESATQGRGKSTGLEALTGPEWFADTGISVGDKDSYQALRGKWIYEFGELASLKGRDVERVKNFVSARRDTYRPSYGRRSRDFARQVVFCGTTNDAHYLTDRTGNRRFWPVTTPNVDVAGLHRDRDQLWAEARVRFENGEPWHVDTAELRVLCEEEQEARAMPDVWIELIRAWLPYPTLPRESEGRRPLVLSEGVTTGDVLLGALNFRQSDIRRGVETRIGRCMRELGWERRQVRDADGHREWRYFAPSPPSPPSSSSSARVTETPTWQSPESHLGNAGGDDGDGGDRVGTGDVDVERAAIQAEGSP